MKPIIATALLACSLLAGGLGSALAQPVFERGPAITVRGDGESRAKPDIARLEAEVVTRGKTLEAASGAHQDRAQRASAALRALEADGLSIEHSTFRLDQMHPPMPMPPVPGPKIETEYQAATSFEIRIGKLERVDAVIAALASSGLFEIRNLRFALDDRNSALDDARRNAVADAQRRAKIYAEAAEIALGEVIEITDSEPRLFREMAAPMRAARGMQVSPPETIAVTANITMSWRIK